LSAQPVDHDANEAYQLHRSLPRANVCHSLPERLLVDNAELERVALDLEQAVKERPELTNVSRTLRLSAERQGLFFILCPSENVGFHGSSD
jgi:hypothetical protein